MYKRLLVGCATLVSLSSVTFAQVAAPVPGVWGYTDTYQLNVLQNLTTADSVINLTNAGAYTPPGNVFTNTGYLCANIYVFGGVAPNDAQGEQLAACCSCAISRNGVASVRGRQLVSNPLTNVTLTAASIKIVWTTPVGGPTQSACNPAALPGANTIAPVNSGTSNGFATGGRAWATHWHTVPSAFGTETQFTNVPLTAPERDVLSNNCAFIIGNGSGAGRCAGCPTGGAQAAASNPL